MRELSTEVIIARSPEILWEYLTDFDAFPAWNPFIKSIVGKKAVGETLTVFIQPPGAKGMTFRPEVIKWEINEEFRWRGKLWLAGLFDGEHYFILERLGPDATKFIQGEKFSGVLVGLFGGMLEKTRRGFEEMNAALKKRCEAEREM